jgi:phosphate transport system substrate-binding protein
LRLTRTALLLAVLAALGWGAAQRLRIDGSSTVYPISLAMAEEFSIENPRVAISVSFSGTGGGLSKLCAGEVDVANASRPVRRSELESCAARGVELLELPIAADAITLVVNTANDFAACVTIDELRAIWSPGSAVKRWSDVRPDWPDERIALYGPGVDSGTFEYFTEAVNGAAGAVRTDFFPSEDDNVLVHGVQSDRYALGYFGFAYYAENPSRVKALQVDGGNGCFGPSAETIGANTYTPLSRPLFVYVSARSAGRPEVEAFVRFYLDPANRELISGSGYVAYGDDVYEAGLERFRRRVTGSAFLDFHPGESVLDAVREE